MMASFFSGTGMTITAITMPNTKSLKALWMLTSARAKMKMSSVLPGTRQSAVRTLALSAPKISQKRT